VGLGLGGVAAGASQFLKGAATDAKALANLAGRPDGEALTFNPGALGEDIQLSDLTPRPAGAADAAAGGRPNVGVTATNWITPKNAATDWETQSDWYNNPLVNAALGKLGQSGGTLGKFGATPDVEFWSSAGQQLKGAGNLWGSVFSNPKGFATEFAGVLGGWSGYRGFAGAMGAVGGKISPLWYAWGAGNGIFNLGAGLAVPGAELTNQLPPVN
jgi:hypothetical protein